MVFGWFLVVVVVFWWGFCLISCRLGKRGLGGLGASFGDAIWVGLGEFGWMVLVGFDGFLDGFGLVGFS